MLSGGGGKSLDVTKAPLKHALDHFCDLAFVIICYKFWIINVVDILNAV